MAHVHEVLWTGGWDSTFRVADLLLTHGAVVQPLYVLNPDRRSAIDEVRTMRRMRARLAVRLANPDALLPLRIFAKDDYPVPKRVATRYATLRRRTRTGSQYLWLAAVAEYHRWSGVELSVTREDPPGGLHRAVFAHPGTGEATLRADDHARLFAYWDFPLLGLRKAELGGLAKDRGFADILLLRQFCFDPVLGRACGRCHPCRTARSEGTTEGVAFASPPLRCAQRVGRSAAARLSRRAP